MANFFLEHKWMILVACTLVSLGALHYIISFIYKKLLPKLEKSYLMWDVALLKAVIFPLKALIWLLGFSFIVQTLSLYFEWDILSNLFTSFRNFAFIAIILWFILRFIKNIETDYIRGKKEKKKPVDKMTVRATCQIARIVTIVIAVLIYLQTRAINISAILAFGGAGGIIAGLAAKDLLANFFGGFMIYLDRPFSVGDWIRSPEKDMEGYVEHIGWRLTRIRTFDKRPLYIPNSLFSTIMIENPSRMSHRRIKTKIGIRYEDASKMKTIVKEVEEMLKTHPEIDAHQTILVCFDEFGRSSLNFLLSAFTEKTDRFHFLHIQQDIFLKTLSIIQNAGAECAFPTSTIHFAKKELNPSLPFNE